MTIAGTSFERSHALDRAIAIAREASQIVMRVYAAPFDVDYKGPNDPVTVADREANELICTELARAFPGIPIVAEESDPASFAGYSAAKAVWFVDPLDGTREFVARNGEFAVMIGLAEEGRATLGVVACPAHERTFGGIVGDGAFELSASGTRRSIRVAETNSLAEASVLVSRSHRAASLDAILERMKSRVVIPTGSSGVKAARVATGEADAYLQPGAAGKRWDACAPEAIVRAAGGLFTDGDGAAFDYAASDLVNARGMVASNVALHPAVIAAIHPPHTIKR